MVSGFDRMALDRTRLRVSTREVSKFMKGHRKLFPLLPEEIWGLDHFTLFLMGKSVKILCASTLVIIQRKHLPYTSKIPRPGNSIWS